MKIYLAIEMFKSALDHLKLKGLLDVTLSLVLALVVISSGYIHREIITGRAAGRGGSTPGSPGSATQTYGPMGCAGIAISPNKNVYLPGETVTITVNGSSQTDRLDLFWKSAYLPMIGPGWQAIAGGNFNNSNNNYTVSWKIPTSASLNWTPADTRNQEILLAVNNFDSSSNFCSGNPGYKNSQGNSCRDGVYNPNTINQTGTCCGGCQKKIVVNQNYSNSVDMKDYLKFEPGNYWEYDGTNLTYSPDRNFRTRFEVEEPSKICGNKLSPVRILKTDDWGYWGPVHSGGSADGYHGKFARRWKTTYFQPGGGDDNSWNAGFAGAIYANSRQLLSAPNQLKDVGPRPQFGNSTYFTSIAQHKYFPPYFISPRYLPGSLNYSFARQDEIYSFSGNQNVDVCQIYNSDEDYNTRGHGWDISYDWENVSTPAYSGQALRIKFLEYSVNTTNPNDLFLLREDWFFAKNIGLVLLRQKELRCPDCNPARNVTRSNCAFNGVNLCETTLSCNSDNCPDLELKLTNAYVGQGLAVSTSDIWTKPGQSMNLEVKYGDGKPYTGYLDFYSNITYLDGTVDTTAGYWSGRWVQDGEITEIIPGNIQHGRRDIKFRRHIPQLPANHLPAETADTFNNTLPWSNTLTLYWQDQDPNDPAPTPLPPAEVTPTPYYSGRSTPTPIIFEVPEVTPEPTITKKR